MPITKLAKKTLKQDKRRAEENRRLRQAFKKAVKHFKENISPETLSQAYTKIDRAAKKHLIHQNKASHLKSQLAKTLKELATKAKRTKKSPKKTAQ